MREVGDVGDCLVRTISEFAIGEIMAGNFTLALRINNSIYGMTLENAQNVADALYHEILRQRSVGEAVP